MKYHAAGTMLAAGLAIERGWAINLGGGMHHACANSGMGWCPFDDITLAIRRVREASGGTLSKVLYIDCDAHQGNGVARDKLLFNDQDLYILDVFNVDVYPGDEESWPAINLPVHLRSGTRDAKYLECLAAALRKADRDFPSPDMVFYNAGTDVLIDDPLGALGVSAQGIINRDKMVWEHAFRASKAPLVMTLSGGYAANNAAVIAASIANLMRTWSLHAQGADK
ncbi:hypothetical protein DUNSADRAFT_3707 [Dunaliella salina]|uniref:Histone deacetylase domain-containing protein n=1 Tax=Dunaliella salina TaxID=3046 RepID=A0ABQ7FV83_DUNSA|nr:hypothetical protein DUNSADRAFT_3707 [Dunaliella salina]|eukprot:KAF5826299.1 hypothetical protein DUNSADRAFT_3707 [Dunaliella salina]